MADSPYRQINNEQGGMDLNAISSKWMQSLLDGETKFLALWWKEKRKGLTEEEKSQKKTAEEIRKENAKSLKEAATQAGVDFAQNAVNNLRGYLDRTMDDFIKTQESMAYNLNGTGEKLKDITNNLNRALNGNGITSQQRVYENLYNLIKQGIVNNAEQRAYLQTLSDDLGMEFKVTHESLTRLIRLQQSDLTSHRMAIQASLKEFLNQNYQTSEYIKQFTEVSASLLEAQSLMSASGGMALESTIQKWMGSLSSLGMSETTIGSLSQALGFLGSGNINALSSSNMQNLLVMGAARSGLSYGDLLHSGLTADAANTLLNGIVTYIAEMGGNDSNVVKSEYARIFGLSVSDIAAAGNLSNSMMDAINGSVIGDDIQDLLAKTDNFVYLTTKISNAIENMKYSWATGIASRPFEYALYRTSELITSVGQAVLDGQELEFGLLGQKVHIDLSKSLNAIPVAVALGLGAGNSLASGSWVTSPMNLFGNLMGGNASGAYNLLSNWKKGGGTAAFAGNLLGFNDESGSDVSGSLVISESSTDDLVKSIKTSAINNASKYATADEIQAKSLDDVYNLLSDAVSAIIDLPNQPFGTVARIAEAGNTVTIGNDLTYIQDLMTLSAMNIQNIYSLLVARFSGQSNANVVDTSSMNWNHPFDWMSTAIGGNA